MQALRGAMKDHNLAVDPTLTIEYQKLFTAASKYREVWTFLTFAVTSRQPEFLCSCQWISRSLRRQLVCHLGLQRSSCILCMTF